MPPPFRSRLDATLAVAPLAFIVACVAHEAVGHGGMCLLVGGRITLLTSVYFRGVPGGPAIDAAGPLMNLVTGTAAWFVTRRLAPAMTPARLFVVLTMAFNLFWGAGYFIYSAVTDAGDWTFVLRELALEPRWVWRVGMGVLGVALYRLAIGAVARATPGGVALVTAYVMAGFVSCLSVLFFAGPLGAALGEAAAESFGANVGLLIIAAARWRRRTPGEPAPGRIPLSRGWLVAAAVGTGAFFVVLGRGYMASQ